MTIDSKHEQYDAFLPDWQLLRDAVSGNRAIKGASLSRIGDRLDREQARAARTYLPKSEGTSEKAYAAYLKRAKWVNVTGRTRTALNGRIWRKDPQKELPSIIEAVEDDITMMGQSLSGFAKTITEEVIGMGRYVVVPSFARLDEDGGRPFLRGYATERVINWGERFIAGANRLVFVVLEETFDTGEGSVFKPDLITAYRVLALVPRQAIQETLIEGSLESGNDLRAVSELDLREAPIGEGPLEGLVYVTGRFVKGDSEKEARRAPNEPPTTVHKVIGQTINEIPIVFFGPTSTGADVEKSPLIDLAHVNVHHYQRTADHALSLFQSGQATPWVNGLTEADRKRIGVLHYGPEKAWMLPKESVPGILEVSGSALAEHRAAMDDDKEEMQALGGRVLADETRINVAAETVRLQQSGEGSILQSIANTCSRGIEDSLKWLVMFDGGEPDGVSYRLNEDVLADTPDPQLLAQLMGLQQARVISQATTYHNLERMDMTRPDVDLEKEQEEIERDIMREG